MRLGGGVLVFNRTLNKLRKFFLPPYKTNKCFLGGAEEEIKEVPFISNINR